MTELPNAFNPAVASFGQIAARLVRRIKNSWTFSIEYGTDEFGVPIEPAVHINHKHTDQEDNELIQLILNAVYNKHRGVITDTKGDPL